MSSFNDQHENTYVASPSGQFSNTAKEGANKWGNSSRLTQSFHFFMFEPIFSPRSPREYLRQRASNGLSDNRCLEI